MANLRAGVVGLGWAGQQHMLGYDTVDGVDLVAICGMEDDVAATLKTTYAHAGGDNGVGAGTGIDSFRDLGEMIRASELDVVSIATPTALHAPLAVQALDAGVHVLSEKPIAETAARAAEMVEASKRNGRVLEVSYNHRRRGVVTALKEAIEDNLLGEIYYAKAGWIRRQGIPGLGGWFTRKASAGGGPFMDIGVHMLDMALHLLGEPTATTVSASTYAEFGPRGLGGSGDYRTVSDASRVDFEVEDLATAFCRLSSGATLVLEASWAQWVPHDLCFVDLYGGLAGAHLEFNGAASGPNGMLTILTDTLGRPTEISPKIPASRGHTGCVEDFVEIVASGSWDGAHGQRSLSRAQVIDAAYASADQHGEISIG